MGGRGGLCGAVSVAARFLQIFSEREGKLVDRTMPSCLGLSWMYPVG